MEEVRFFTHWSMPELHFPKENKMKGHKEPRELGALGMRGTCLVTAWHTGHHSRGVEGLNFQLSALFWLSLGNKGAGCVPVLKAG